MDKELNSRPKRIFAFAALATIALVIFTFFLWEENQTSNQLTLYGNIDIRQADLGFRVFGKLKTMKYEEGDLVEKGTLLAELEEDPYRHTVKEAEEKAKGLKNQLDLAEILMKRRDLLTQDHSVSEEEYQQAFYEEKVTRASLKEAKAKLANAKTQYEDTKLYSPSKGTIFTRVREPGAIIKAGDPVYSLAVEAPIWARTYISETHLGKIYPGMPATIETDSSGVYKGRIGFISPIAEFTPKSVETPDLRTSLVYQLRVFIDKPDRGLRQGMPVTIKFDVEKETKQSKR